MEELCKKDGGTKVYEKVILPTAEFEALRKSATTADSSEDHYGSNYRYLSKLEVLVGLHANAQKGEGQITRWHQAIYRRADGRLLGESVLYDRSGGDGFTFGFQPSGNYCPKPRVGLYSSVFLEGK